MTELAELPGSWVHTTLEAVTQPKRVSVQPSDHSTLPYVGMEHVEAETMRLLGTVPAGEMRSNALRFQPGDVLYGRLRPYLNKVLKPEFEGLCSPEFIVFPESPHLISGYLQYFLNSWRFKTFASHLNAGDRPRVDWDQLKVYGFPLPPLAEQRRIVAAIDEQFTRLDAGVAALKRAQAVLKRYRAAVLKAAVEGRLTAEWRTQHPDVQPASELLADILAERRAKWEANLRAKGKDPAKAMYEERKSPRAERLPELPHRWVWVHLDNIATRVTDGTHQPPAFIEQGVPFIFVQHIVGGSIRFDNTKFVSQETFDELTRRCRVERGDVLYSAVGSYGVAVPVNTEQPFTFQRHIAHIKLSEPTSQAYFVLCLNSPWCLAQAHRAAKGVAQKTVTLGDLSKFVLPLPPLREQYQIAEEVERLLSVVADVDATITANLKRAERLRQAILERAFRGRLVPQDPADEPASVMMERIRRERVSAGSVLSASSILVAHTPTQAQAAPPDRQARQDPLW